jgi:endonuclease YncB( thermonuclease family)
MKHTIIFFLILAVVFRSERCAAQSDAKSGYSISGLTITQRDTLPDGIIVTDAVTYSDSAELIQSMAAKVGALRTQKAAWAAMYSRDSLALDRAVRAKNAYDGGSESPRMVKLPPGFSELSDEESPGKPLFDVLAIEDESTEPITKYRVVYCHDGDTYWTLFPGENKNEVRRIRPIGFDCDEVKHDHLPISQPFGEFVRDTVSKMLKADSIVLQVVGFDVYGRTLARVYWRGQDLASIILRNGWGDYLTSSVLDAATRKEYQRIRNEAKRAKRGRWSAENQKQYTESGNTLMTPRQWRKKYQIK